VITSNRDGAGIAEMAFTSKDRGRDVPRNCNADRSSSLYPKYKGGRRVAAPAWLFPGWHRRLPQRQPHSSAGGHRL
jgi:hypothetical protein